MKSFINRPIPRLLRYELLLKSILEETPEGHDDILAIPAVLDLIKSLGKDSEPGVVSAKQKVELWRYNSNLVFKPGEVFVSDVIFSVSTFFMSSLCRTWTCSTRIDPLFIRVSYFDNLILVLDGQNYLWSYWITTVSNPLLWVRLHVTLCLQWLLQDRKTTRRAWRNTTFIGGWVVLCICLRPQISNYARTSFSPSPSI